jgi:hypothetical protein
MTPDSQPRQPALRPLETVLQGDRVLIGEHFAFSLQRTLRLPDDDREYPLPPGLGTFPLKPVDDLGDRAPAEWRAAGGFVVPVYQREAVWLSFTAPWWRPVVVMVGVGGINAVSGESWSDELRADPQNYVVCPDQPWLDGVNTGAGTVRQFVAVSLGAGDTVEEQLSGAALVGGMQLRVYEPKSGRFDEAPPAGEAYGLESVIPQETGSVRPSMGVAPGGILRQRIYPDPYGIDTWDRGQHGTALIHLVNSEQYEALTGSPPPATPVSAATYTQSGLPWFSLYDEERGDVAASERLRSTRSLRERDTQRGAPPRDADKPVEIEPGSVVELPNRPDSTTR